MGSVGVGLSDYAIFCINMNICTDGAALCAMKQVAAHRLGHKNHYCD